MLFTASAKAQVLQNGDYVIAANGYSGGYYGRFFRLRGQALTLLFESGASGVDFSEPRDVIIDSQGRVVFGNGSCGGNSNNAKLLRWDPVTGVLSELICIPYYVGPGGPPPGFPTDATGLHGPINGLHLTRSLKVSIDDDVNGGMPQVGYADAYAFSVGVYPRRVFLYGQWYDREHPEVFRYVVDEDRVEPGISTDLIPVASSGPVEMFADSGGTYYAGSQGSRIFLAQPDLNIDVRARTVVSGTEVVVSGALRVAGRNELVLGPAPLESTYAVDNTAVPNVTLTCNINGVDVTDSNNPREPDGGYRPFTDIKSLGVLNGGIFISSGSPSSAFFFDLAPREPFLNTYYCSYVGNCVQGFGPYPASPNRPYLAYTTVHNGRILGGDNQRVYAVNASTFEVLADDPLLIGPRGVAGYPSETPALNAATLVVRVDSPVNVLVTDASGRRIGHDAAGNTINDFGPSGAVLALGPEGHPRVYALINPPTGTYGVQVVGTGDGPYTIRSYLAETSTGGAFIARTGQAQTGVAEDLSLHIHGPLTQAWLRLGDMNCDSAINHNDVPPFVQALLDPMGFAAQFPLCELYNADMNRDSGVNGGDIQPFMTKIIQG